MVVAASEGEGEKVMIEWSVRFEISRPDLEFTEDHANGVMSYLEQYAPVVSYGLHVMSVRFCVHADSPDRAAKDGLMVAKFAMHRAGLGSEGIVAFEISDRSDLARTLEEPNVPDLIGVDELAKILKVSKQRASELAKRRDFPRPIVRLASGPVWKKSTIARFVAYWDRRPGRKRTLTTA